MKGNLKCSLNTRGAGLNYRLIRLGATVRSGQLRDNKDTEEKGRRRKKVSGREFLKW